MQQYTRISKNGAEHMAGMNRETEPRGVIRGVFDLFDHFRDRPQHEHPVIAVGVLGQMLAGQDLSAHLWNSFVVEHERELGRVPMKQYGEREEPIILGVGRRDLPPLKNKATGEKLPPDAWARFN
jgi:hypothetical protein